LDYSSIRCRVGRRSSRFDPGDFRLLQTVVSCIFLSSFFYVPCFVSATPPFVYVSPLLAVYPSTPNAEGLPFRFSFPLALCSTCHRTTDPYNSPSPPPKALVFLSERRSPPPHVHHRSDISAARAGHPPPSRPPPHPPPPTCRAPAPPPPHPSPPPFFFLLIRFCFFGFIFSFHVPLLAHPPNVYSSPPPTDGFSYVREIFKLFCGTLLLNSIPDLVVCAGLFFSLAAFMVARTSIFRSFFRDLTDSGVQF